VSVPPAGQKEGTGLTPGAANSGSGVGGRETLRPDPASALDKASSRPAPKSVGSPRSPQFNTLDADRDGRISLTEFTTSSSAWLRQGASGAGASATAGAREAQTTPGSAGPLAGPSSATSNARLFQQADTNRDGYLSPAELDAYRAPTASER
jgi:hypothetical protein